MSPGSSAVVVVILAGLAAALPRDVVRREQQKRAVATTPPPNNCALIQCDIPRCETEIIYPDPLSGKCCPYCAESCDSFECQKGEACRIFSRTGEAYCDPDCSMDNGGCEADQQCIQALALCSIDSLTPCPGFVTCVNNTSSSCPDGSEPVFCFVNPCDVTTCPNHPNATCEADYCGGCNALFFDRGGNEVTKTCQSKEEESCDIEGQVFQNCRSCPSTCFNPELICTLQCVPGCGCPPGQLIDEVTNSCVDPANCSDLPPPPTPCPLRPCRLPANCSIVIPPNPLDPCACPTCGDVPDCSAVLCLKPDCDDPLPPPPGQCCSSCPKGSKEICELKPDMGPCEAYSEQYFYNSTSEMCEEFIYGGCDGNKNRFVSVQECEKKCIYQGGRQICELEPDVGPCDAAFVRYFYNSTSETCEDFIYGGCEGNENKFTSQEECVEKCAKEKITIDCRAVRCAAPSCPDPILSDPSKGKCCDSCPEGSSCPFTGQYYQSCGSACPATCTNPFPLCITVCSPGCHCPFGQVIDEKSGSCIPLDECPIDCNLVDCAVPSCPDPTPADPANGICCSICPKNSTCPIAGQVYDSCGSACPKTCTNQNLLCIQVCSPGCHCPSGQVIDEESNSCVTVDECPVDCNLVDCAVPSCPDPIPADPASGICCSICPKNSTCPIAGQVYDSCGSACPKTCTDQNPLCIQVCSPGCHCPSGQVIDEESNSCVTVDECAESTVDCRVVRCGAPSCPDPILADPSEGRCCDTCPEGSSCPITGQYYQSCGSACPATCTNPSPLCITVCSPGCHCPFGQVIDEKSGSCVPLDECPIDCNLVDCGVPSCPDPIPADPASGICCSICPENSTCPIAGQVYDSCGSSCPKTCTDQNPLCIQLCSPGCHCPSGQVIDEEGNSCVTVDECPDSTCPITGQVYDSCGSSCPKTCANPNPLCIQVCSPGCHCPSGQVINEETNSCVTVDECTDKDEDSANICQLPAEIGKCRARIKRYYFNSKTGKCELFIYGGCSGNGNNFQTLTECRKQCGPPKTSRVDCSAVLCPVPTCPDPIPPNPSEGECCSVCPPGSTCPVIGEFYQQCKGCPVTCADRGKPIPCPAICVPGCACPSGQVVNEKSNTCVLPEDCPGTCELDPEVGPCKAAIPRYFYNATSKRCELFIYGGCQGNKNNFETLSSCEKECSECAPTCTPDYCKRNSRNAKCSIPSGSTPGAGGCFGDCDETICTACYYSNKTLSLPPLKKGCPALCPVDAKGQIFGKTCLKKWGKCVKNANLNTYGEPLEEVQVAENYKCWRPSCPKLQIG